MDETAFESTIAELVRYWKINEAAELSRDLGISMDDFYRTYVRDLDPDQIRTLATALRVSSDVLLFGPTEEVVRQVIVNRVKAKESEQQSASAPTGFTVSDADELDVVVDKLSLVEAAIYGVGLDGNESSQRGALLLLAEIIEALQGIRAKM